MVATSPFKTLLLGDSGVGKSSLLRALCGTIGAVDISPTRGIEFAALPLQENSTTLQVWDVPAAHESPSLFQDVALIILVFDITNPASLQSTAQRYAAARARVGPRTPIVIVGNKVDATMVACVSVDDAKALIKDAVVLLTSAVSGAGVEDVVNRLKPQPASAAPAVQPVDPAPTSNQTDFDRLLKIVLIGPSCAGKSALLNRIAFDSFDSEYKPTIGVEFGTRLANRTKFQVWDTAGNPRFAAITRAYHRGAAAQLLVYDITSRQSFIDLAGMETESPENCVHFVLGAKCDLADLREVTAGEGAAYARSIGAQFLEVSSAENMNIERALQLITELVRERVQADDRSNQVCK